MPNDAFAVEWDATRGRALLERVLRSWVTGAYSSRFTW